MKRLFQPLYLFLLLQLLILTASDAFAETRCWNQTRGFDSFSTNWAQNTNGNEAVISNQNSDTLNLLTNLDRPDRFDFIFKTKNRRCSPAKKYSYIDSNGGKHSVRLPGWSIVIDGGEGKKLEYRIIVTETETDGISSAPALKIQLFEDSRLKDETMFSSRDSHVIDKIKSVASGPDYTGAMNSWRLALENGTVTLSGALHSPATIFSTPLPSSFIPQAVGFRLAPGAELEFSEMRLEESRMKAKSADSPWTDEENLLDYLKNSNDIMEGYWQILDRSMEDNLIRLGGDYKLAIIKAADGYDIIYLDGAKVNKGEWRPGMIKGHLSPSGIENVWEASWTDSMFGVIGNEIKATLEQPGTLSIQFPYQGSTMRLQKTGN